MAAASSRRRSLISLPAAGLLGAADAGADPDRMAAGFVVTDRPWQPNRLTRLRPMNEK